jgi:hypothetical protein
VNIDVGDEILVTKHSKVHRLCEVLEVGDPEGGAPYLVRWKDDGREVYFCPGPHATHVPRKHLTAGSP